MREANGIVISMLLIDLMRTTVAVFLQEQELSRFADEALLCTAMFLAQAEGRPMTLSKIAEYIGMPRPTADRKLRALQKRGVVEQVDKKRWRIPLSNPDIDARVTKCTAEQVNNLQRAIARMSKLETVSNNRQKLGT
ncbi:helix-turn-helix domain-containing protein [Bradyrhizobium sp. 613_E4_N2_2]|uniref:helix-turn-helix domain-containing protein n=1 Tax=Bradyrhizobium sp. 613_E4_N2_2 TaxID=3240371 RepID=UPI003F8A91B6